MKKVYLLEDAIISPLGFSTHENIEAVKNKISALKYHQHPRFSSGGYYAGIIQDELLDNLFSEKGKLAGYTKLEKMMILAVEKVLAQHPGLDLAETALIVSTTKGNINLLQANSNFPENRIYLTELARVIKEFFKFRKEPIVISNACVSGGLALSIAKRFIKAGKFPQAIVVGGDLVSDFVVSGFQSFQALSEEPCKPFSLNRTGINLGEAAAAILVSAKKPEGSQHILLLADASANDANHISGPSRTGEGLYKSIETALKEAQISAEDLDYISAHGTGTLFNDEMEAVTYHRCNLEDIPVNSYKAYYGHTLGASALVESILTKHSLLSNELYPSLNYESSGVSKPLNVIQHCKKTPLQYALKTASGFGGCNLALVFKKEEDE